MADSRFKRVAALVAALAALHGLAYVPLVHRHVTTDTDTYVATANALERGSYTTPLRAGFYYTYPEGFYDLTGIHVTDRSLFTEPEKQAFRTPGYPLLLALLGDGGPGATRHVVLVVQALLLGLATWLLALTVRRWWGPRAAVATAALYALDPYSKHYVTLVVTETLAALGAVATAYAFTRAWQQRDARWWAAAAAGAAALTLVRPVFVLAVPLVVAAAAVRCLPRAAGVLAGAAAAAVLLAPWLAWTNHVVGSPVLTSWGEGFNLLLAAHGERLGRNAAEIQRDPSFLRDFAGPRRDAPSAAELRADPYAHPRYLHDADTALQARARSLYRSRLAGDPAEVAWENVYRNYFLWSTHHDWYQPSGAALVALQAVDWILIALALVGVAVALAAGGAPRWVAVYLLVYSVTLATHHVEARFSIPLRGLFLGYAVLGALAVASRAQTQKGIVAVAPTT